MYTLGASQTNSPPTDKYVAHLGEPRDLVLRTALSGPFVVSLLVRELRLFVS